MKARLFQLFSVLLCVPPLALGAVKDAWERGRVVEVRKSVESKPLYWIANTPITKDETSYTIMIQLGPKLLVGVYTLDKSHAAPPDQWVRGWPVKVRVDNDDMYLEALSGESVKLRIVKRKSGETMQPVSDAEIKKAYAPTTPPEPPTGFSDSDTKHTGADVEPAVSGRESGSEAAAQPEGTTAAGPIGMIDVTTVPYLAQIYIDGTSLGYSPAKLTLPAGKHVMRVEKNGYQPWSKEITVLESSEFTVFAELRKK